MTLLTQDNENGFQQKMKILAVFVDLTKAFDKVWKEGLLFKLPRKKVCGKMFSWIQSYLFQRSARVRLEGQTSSLVKIRGARWKCFKTMRTGKQKLQPSSSTSKPRSTIQMKSSGH